jgi:hypothetical protein
VGTEEPPATPRSEAPLFETFTAHGVNPATYLLAIAERETGRHVVAIRGAQGL